ncbi:MAG: phosphoribosylanthranilate isomerase [Chitinophagaceae bacterium]|nr:MAG: phosphoribosylanthranilate isomerase [Chitinophagaceae bacterium]
MKLKLKVCGMKHAANIAAVAELHPDYLGFIFYAKSPRFIGEVSAELIKYIPTSIKTTGVFVNEALETVKTHVLKHNLKAAQLHGNESEAYCRELRLTGIDVIKAFGVGENFNFSRLEGYLNVVDYFLFDTQTPQHGGSGKVFDWRLLQNYTLDKPYFLSGGIDLNHARHIQEIKDPRLFAIDINSKFEVEPGLKDVEKIEEFINELNTVRSKEEQGNV